jgi:hypothetical protein
MRTLTLAVALCFGPSCSVTPAEPSGARQADTTFADAPKPDHAPPLRERLQSSYFTTSVRTRDGQRFNAGHAELTVSHARMAPDIVLEIRALGPHDEHWVARFELPEEALLSGKRAELTFAGVARAQLTRVLGGAQVAKTNDVQLSFEVVSGTERRSVLKGRVESPNSALSADFQTEVGVTCMVPHAALGLGQEGTVSSDNNNAAVALAIDTRLMSHACRKYKSLL